MRVPQAAATVSSSHLRVGLLPFSNKKEDQMNWSIVTMPNAAALGYAEAFKMPPEQAVISAD